MTATVQFQTEVKNLIDSLKGICSNYGLGNDGDEYKIITQVFLYKFLNDKFAYEVKQLNPELAKAEKWQKAIEALPDEDYEMLTLQLNADTAVLQPSYNISESSIEWQVSSFTSGATAPVSSNIKFSDIRSKGIGFEAGWMSKMSKNTVIILGGKYQYEKVNKGSANESVYAKDGSLTSETLSDIDGNKNYLGSIDAGIKKRWFGSAGHYYFANLGYEMQKIGVSLANGSVTIPSNSGSQRTTQNFNYDLELRKFLITLGTEHRVWGGNIAFEYRFSKNNQFGKGNFQSGGFSGTNSFSHDINGYGQRLSASYMYQINRYWDIGLEYSIEVTEGKKGYDSAYVPGSSDTLSRIDDMKTEFKNMSLDLRYVF